MPTRAPARPRRPRHTQRALALDTPARATPFLKWAGGKGQLLAQLEVRVPESFGRYIEPFVGGGALFFRLHAQGRLGGGALLNDRNPELIDCYRVVQDAARLDRLIERLHEHGRHVMDSDYYYTVRAWDRRAGFRESHGTIERAARTLFLNHTCYNGLYRLNKSGQFNVPYGKWSRPPSLFGENNLRACHEALQGVELREESFEDCLRRAQAGDFVYLDPPYHPVSSTASFTTYTGFEFREQHQRRLAEVYGELDGRGCRLLLSNSATPLIRRLYGGCRIETVLATRAISCNGKGRGKVQELLILNA